MDRWVGCPPIGLAVKGGRPDHHSPAARYLVYISACNHPWAPLYTLVTPVCYAFYPQQPCNCLKGVDCPHHVVVVVVGAGLGEHLGSSSNGQG